MASRSPWATESYRAGHCDAVEIGCHWLCQCFVVNIDYARCSLSSIRGGTIVGMNKPAWKFWLLFGCVAAGAHLVFGSGWSKTPDRPRTCGCLIDLSKPESEREVPFCPIAPSELP